MVRAEKGRVAREWAAASAAEGAAREQQVQEAEARARGVLARARELVVQHLNLALGSGPACEEHWQQVRQSRRWRLARECRAHAAVPLCVTQVLIPGVRAKFNYTLPVSAEALHRPQLLDALVHNFGAQLRPQREYNFASPAPILRACPRRPPALRALCSPRALPSR